MIIYDIVLASYVPLKILEMKKKFLIKVRETDLSYRIQILSAHLKMKYLFELILIRDLLPEFRNLGSVTLAELDAFIQEKITEEEKEWLWGKVKKILKVRVIDNQTLFNSREFKTLIKKLKNPNSDYEKADELTKKLVYQELSQVMVNKLVKLVEVLPKKPLNHFFQPNQDISLSLEVRRKLSVEEFNLPIEDFQKRIKKFLIKKLIYEIKKPEY